jgi:hypothetical protein
MTREEIYSYLCGFKKNWMKQELADMVDGENIIRAFLIIGYESVSQSVSSGGVTHYFCTPILKIQAYIGCANE